MQSLPLYQVDSFSAEPFGGNPAAVCLLPSAREEAWMQRVAMEMNLSETAFLLRRDDGFSLRWFTPSAEVDLCGHATLASAHVLWETGESPASTSIAFHTRSGLLTAEKMGEWIHLDFPSEPPVACDPAPGLLQALGVEALWVGKNRFDFLVEVASETLLHGVQPDFRALAAATERGVMVTCADASGPHDFLSRFFAPSVGVDEDPVTGSAHCCLGPFWAQRLGKEDLRAFQASRRGGEVRVKVAGDRVTLSGRAVTVLKAALFA